MLIKGKSNLDESLKVLEKYANDNKLTINKNKSAIMIVRKDHRTPIPIEFRSGSYIGYPIVNKYKYLGVEFDDKFTLKPEIEKRKE